MDLTDVLKLAGTPRARQGCETEVKVGKRGLDVFKGPKQRMVRIFQNSSTIEVEKDKRIQLTKKRLPKHVCPLLLTKSLSLKNI